MDRPRSSIAHLMIWVALLAVNAAALRFAWVAGGVTWELTILLGLLALSIQVGFVRALLGGRGARVFWVGYAAGGVAAALSWLWYLLGPPDARPPVVGAFWRVYPDWIGAPLEAFPRLGAMVYGNRAAQGAWNLLAAYLPLGLAGAAVGACARAVGGRLRPRPGGPEDPGAVGRPP